VTDPFFQLLLQQASKIRGPQLLIADENLKSAPLHLLLNQNITLITNRFDVGEQAHAAGLNYHFSDFDFSSLADNSFDQLLYRVSKEKSVTHHIINSAQRLLKQEGNLVLAGEKNDGVKTYTDKACRYFGSATKPKKQGTTYISVISNQQRSVEPLLDDCNYSQLRSCITVDNQTFFSKPGLFGWNKVDQGSAFLADFLSKFFQHLGAEPKQVLDLGCGYGYLSLMASKHTNAQITATDNNAAAISACSKNFSEFSINGEVIAGDCAGNINKKFDAVLCNPPFHQGFDTDNVLTQCFVDSSYQHLNQGGKALFVANRFVPIERCAEKLYKTKNMEKIADNKSFKLLLLSKK
jgi:16S rRNA (guanine1207-N2)-methyltransferase